MAPLSLCRTQLNRSVRLSLHDAKVGILVQPLNGFDIMSSAK